MKKLILDKLEEIPASVYLAVFLIIGLSVYGALVQRPWIETQTANLFGLVLAFLTGRQSVSASPLPSTATLGKSPEGPELPKE